MERGLGTLAVRPWHLQECVQSPSDCSCHMTTIELTTRKLMRGGAGYACAHHACVAMYICAHCAYLHVLLNALYIFMTMSCDCNPACHSLMARVPRPSFCMLVTQYIQHCGKLGYGSWDYPFSGTPTGSVVVSCRLVQPGLAWILANLLPRVCFISKEVCWKCFLQVLATLQVINTCILGGSLYYLARESQWY